MEIRKGDKVWALVGYPMKPTRVTVASIKHADRLSDGIMTTEEGFSVYESLVFKKKPRQIKVSDEYGTITKWVAL